MNINEAVRKAQSDLFVAISVHIGSNGPIRSPQLDRLAERFGYQVALECWPEYISLVVKLKGETYTVYSQNRDKFDIRLAADKLLWDIIHPGQGL